MAKRRSVRTYISNSEMERLKEIAKEVREPALLEMMSFLKDSGLKCKFKGDCEYCAKSRIYNLYQCYEKAMNSAPEIYEIKSKELSKLLNNFKA